MPMVLQVCTSQMNTQLGQRFSHWTNIIQYRCPVRNIFATDSFATTPTRIPQNMAKFFLKITVKYVRSLTRPNTGENIVKVERRRSAPPGPIKAAGPRLAANDRGVLHHQSGPGHRRPHLPAVLRICRRTQKDNKQETHHTTTTQPHHTTRPPHHLAVRYICSAATNSTRCTYTI